MVAKVCQALAYMQSSEQIDEARALSCPKLCGCIVYGSYGLVVPYSCAGVSLTIAMAVRTKAVWLLRLFAPKL